MLYGKRTVAIVLDATDGVQFFAKLGVCEPYPKSENSTNHTGTCPRCAKPRLEYNPIKKFTKCFNEECGFGGGIIQTVMEVRGCTDDEAIEFLAKEAEVQIPKRPPERRKIFGFFKDSIPYYRGLRDVAGSLPAAVLMGQLEYWFEKKPEGFYKFLEPSENDLYEVNDSWTEVLNISPEEFRTAFDRIGKRYPSKKSFEATPEDDRFFKSVDEEYLYCSYFDKIKGTTHYLRNKKVDSIIEKLITTGMVKRKKKQVDGPLRKIKTKTGVTLFIDPNGRFVSGKR